MIRYRDVKNLKYNARDFAMMMDTRDLDSVIAEFVAAKSHRGNQTRAPPK